MSQSKPRSDIEVQLAQFDYDKPVEEWSRAEKKELLDLLEQTDTNFGAALREIRETDSEGDQS